MSSVCCVPCKTDPETDVYAGNALGHLLRDNTCEGIHEAGLRREEGGIGYAAGTEASDDHTRSWWLFREALNQGTGSSHLWMQFTPKEGSSNVGQLSGQRKCSAASQHHATLLFSSAMSVCWGHTQHHHKFNTHLSN